jgi:hypothetical protein
MDEAKPASSKANIEFLRTIQSTFLDLLIQNLALRSVLVEKGYLTHDQVESRVEQYRNSKTFRDAQTLLTEFDSQALARILEEFEGPVQ